MSGRPKGLIAAAVLALAGAAAFFYHQNRQPDVTIEPAPHARIQMEADPTRDPPRASDTMSGARSIGVPLKSILPKKPRKKSAAPPRPRTP